MEENEIYKKAILQLGVANQTQMLMEECAELIVAIQHNRRGKVPLRVVAGECADVEIMLGQMRVLMGDTIDKMKRIKLDRLERTLEEV